MKDLHVHIYDETSQADDNLVEELDLVLQEDYGDYLQYGFQIVGKGLSYWVEIRVPKE